MKLADGFVDLKIARLNAPVRLYASFQAVHELICSADHLVNSRVVTHHQILCELQARAQHGDDYTVSAGAVHLPLNLVEIVGGDFVGTGGTPPGGVRCSLDLDERLHMVIATVDGEAVRGGGVACSYLPPAAATVADAQLWVSVCEPAGDRLF